MRVAGEFRGGLGSQLWTANFEPCDIVFHLCLSCLIFSLNCHRANIFAPYHYAFSCCLLCLMVFLLVACVVLSTGASHSWCLLTQPCCGSVCTGFLYSCCVGPLSHRLTATGQIITHLSSSLECLSCGKLININTQTTTPP